MPIDQQPPEVLALLIADHVHQDDSSGKFFILGTRSAIGSPTFPNPAITVSNSGEPASYCGSGVFW